MSDDRSFEELQRELEEIVTRLERGDVPWTRRSRSSAGARRSTRRASSGCKSAELRIEELAPPEAGT